MEGTLVLLQLSLWLGILSLYLGFAGVLGVLARRALLRPASAFEQGLAAAYGALLYLPASVLVLALPEWALVLRLTVFVGGLALVALAARQPEWLPARLWQRAFGHHYFAGAMALAALWGAGLAFTAQAFTPVIVGLAATLAGAASLLTAPARALRESAGKHGP